MSRCPTAPLRVRRMLGRLLLIVPIAAAAALTPVAADVTNAATTTTTVVATPTSVHLSGRWYAVFNASLLGRRGEASHQLGATLSYTFTGSSVSLIGPKSTHGSSARVSIDGRLVRTVSALASTYQPRATLFSAHWASSGKHTITVSVAATRYAFIVSGLVVQRTVAPATTVASGKVVTVGPSTSAATFRSLAANLSVGVIQMAAGTYHGYRAVDLPNRAGHPLTIRPVAGATVTFDASRDGNYGDRAFGFLGASYITFDGTPGRFVFQHYLIAQTGVFLLINASHITIKGVTFTNIAANARSNAQSSHLFYVSHGVSYLDIENISASHLLASDEPGGVYGLNGIQLYTGGTAPAIHDVTVRNVSISSADWGVVVRNGAYHLLFDGVHLTSCGHGGVSAAADFGSNNTGTVRSSTSTVSYSRPLILGVMTDGGSNSFH
jgi:hypothetical protein